MCYKNMENYNKEIERNLYLRELLLGNIQGPLTGIPNIDRPWLKYYTKEELMAGSINKTVYRYLYDENNNIISYRNNNDDLVKFEYNSENQQTKFENNFGYFEKYTYENNNIVQIKNNIGKIYKYTYDADNNLIGYNTDKLSFSIEIK